MSPWISRVTLIAAILLIGVMAVVAACILLNIGPRSAHYALAGSTALTGERIGPYSLEQDITGILPAPVRSGSGHSDYELYSIPDGPNISTLKRQSRIIRIWGTDAGTDTTTARGIAIGSTRNDVLAAYGKDFYSRSEQGVSIIGYIDKNSRHSLEFWMHEDKVPRSGWTGRNKISEELELPVKWSGSSFFVTIRLHAVVTIVTIRSFR